MGDQEIKHSIARLIPPRKGQDTAIHIEHSRINITVFDDKVLSREELSQLSLDF